MRTTVFLGLLLVGFVASAPATDTTKEDDDKVTVTKEFFPDELAVYTSQYDIVNIFVPVDTFNFDESSEESTTDNTSNSTLIFFVEADDKEEKGLYSLKDGITKKLLDYGRDITNENRVIYFAAKDGIYVYNLEKQTAEKYGSVTDGLTGIVKVHGADVLYVLGEDKYIYKVTDNGTKKEKVEGAENVEQIVPDTSSNIYFYESDKKLRVITNEGIKIIEGLPENPSKVTLLRPPFIIEEGIPVVIDDKAYTVYANGKSEPTDFTFAVKPSAYSMEATLIQYYAYNKKIYEYNILALIASAELEDELKEFFDENKETIQSIANRTAGAKVKA